MQDAEIGSKARAGPAKNCGVLASPTWRRSAFSASDRHRTTGVPSTTSSFCVLRSPPSRAEGGIERTAGLGERMVTLAGSTGCWRALPAEELGRVGRTRCRRGDVAFASLLSPVLRCGRSHLIPPVRRAAHVSRQPRPAISVPRAKRRHVAVDLASYNFAKQLKALYEAVAELFYESPDHLTPRPYT
jgi:hypothetical protein